MIAVLTLAAGCGGGGGGTSGKKAANQLVLIDVSVAGFDGVALNEMNKFEFSEILDPDTVRPDTINIREGPNYGKQVPGFFRVDGNEVLFYPRLPTLPDLSDSGMQPGKNYRITLPAVPSVATVRSFANDRLKKEKVETFSTAIAGSKDLFVDNFLDPLPPRVLFVNPPDGAIGVPAASAITLTFNRRPLHPGTVTDSNLKLTMIERAGEALNRPIPGTQVLTQSHDSVQIVFRPTFPLADVATYKLHVDRACRTSSETTSSSSSPRSRSGTSLSGHPRSKSRSTKRPRPNSWTSRTRPRRGMSSWPTPSRRSSPPRAATAPRAT